MSHTLPAPPERVPLGRMTPSGDVLITPEWLRYLSHALPRLTVSTADQAESLADLMESVPTADAHVRQQDDAPAPDAHVMPADDAPGDLAALRAEFDALRDRVQALELK